MLQKKYAQTQEPAIASYSYTDIAAGTGVQTFYAASATSGANFILTSETLYSENVMTWAGTDNANYAKKIDLDFDVELNLPRRIKGDLIANVPFGIGWKEASTGTNSYAVVTLKKVDVNDAETTIATATGKVLGIGGTAIGQVMDCIILDVPLTHYKKGEKIRITVEIWAKRENAVTVFVLLGHDPQSRAYGYWDQINGGAPKDFDFGTTPTNMSFRIPFVLDL